MLIIQKREDITVLDLKGAPLNVLIYVGIYASAEEEDEDEDERWGYIWMVPPQTGGLDLAYSGSDVRHEREFLASTSDVAMELAKENARSTLVNTDTSKPRLKAPVPSHTRGNGSSPIPQVDK